MCLETSTEKAATHAQDEDMYMYYTQGNSYTGNMESVDLKWKKSKFLGLGREMRTIFSWGFLNLTLQSFWWLNCLVHQHSVVYQDEKIVSQRGRERKICEYAYLVGYGF